MNFIIGGKGFIGGHLHDRIGGTTFDLKDGQDARDLDQLTAAMDGHDQVFLLASNPDLAAAQFDPDIDYRNGTVITRNTVEAMRSLGIKRLVYASGSGVYGDRGTKVLSEDDIGMPVSPYGASKLASEAIINAYANLGFLNPLVLRFANVVGPRATHGVVFDFLAKLLDDPTRLEILGDGQQTKGYLYVQDAVDALTMPISGTYNAAPLDQISVRTIACVVCQAANVYPEFVYTGGSVGWPGDVPQVYLNARRLMDSGWHPQFLSVQAVEAAL